MCEPNHTHLSDTRHKLKLLQYDSTRFALMYSAESHMSLRVSDAIREAGFIFLN